MDFNSPGQVNIHQHQFQRPQSPNGAPFATQYQHMEQHIEPGASRNLHPQASPHILTHDANRHLHHQYYQDQNHDRHSLATPQTPSQHQSPRFSTLSPAQPRQIYQQPSSYIPQDRALPDRNVTEDNLTDAYVAFILYCNPSFPLSVDTTKLKDVFTKPPMSDKQSFDIFKLYGLIKRFEAGEIKSWVDLATEFGVAKPDMEKGQSSQKVQQYSVRLKRWMKAHHIDAFFEYLCGNEAIYIRELPSPNEPHPASRDGVVVGEDYALRALDPSLRPKRGRRRADEQDDDMEPASAIEPKRPHLDTSVFGNRDNSYPQSAYPSSAPVPMSAHPDGLDSYVNGDPWSALTPAQHSRSALTASQQQIRWARNETPSTPHPAMTPMSAHPDHYFDEPRSAVTPSSSRKRAGRKHGPATSSAWTSRNTTKNGKLRGRPPSNRSVRDGPFGTFPADPKTKEAPTIDINRNHITSATAGQNSTPTPGATESPKPQFLTPQQPTPISATTPHTLALLNSRPTHPLLARPERLQVQVPENRGGPVSLITPTLLVNGRLNESPLTQEHQHAAGSLQTPALSTASTARTMTSTSSFFSTGNESAVTDMDDHYNDRGSHYSLPPKSSPMMESAKESSVAKLLTNEDVKRALAAELLRAEISGRTKRLRGQEAKDLAQALLQRSLTTHPNDPGGQSASHSPSSTQHANHLQGLATWFGLTSSLGLNSPLAPSPQTGGNKKITIRRFKVNDDGYDSPIDDDSDDPMGRSTPSAEHIRESYDVEWSASLGGIVGKFSVKGLFLSKSGSGNARGEDDTTVAGSGATEVDASSGGELWKEKFLLSERRLRELDDENRALKNKIRYQDCSSQDSAQGTPQSSIRDPVEDSAQHPVLIQDPNQHRTQCTLPESWQGSTSGSPDGPSITPLPSPAQHGLSSSLRLRWYWWLLYCCYQAWFTFVYWPSFKEPWKNAVCWTFLCTFIAILLWSTPRVDRLMKELDGVETPQAVGGFFYAAYEEANEMELTWPSVESRPYLYCVLMLCVGLLYFW